METKIINVFFDANCLPYKDKERQVHYPITSGAFLGASDTTKIRFYFDRIGNSNTTWVGVAKLPNGKQGSKVLSVSEDSELNENYAELSLDNWFTQAKGDVYIALQGYQGGVQYSYDSESGLYEITGTPTIQTTGSIKLAINYAPIGDSPDYTDEFTTYQEILAALGDKLDITSGIIVVNDITQQQASNYENGQVFYNLADKKVYQLSGETFNVIFETYSKSEIDTALDLKADKSTTYTKTETDALLNAKQDTLVSGTNIKSLTVDGVEKSLLGSGTIEVGTGSGGGAWGEITGDIQDQTDLQNEFQNVREVAEGKCKTYVLSYNTTAPATDISATQFMKPDGTHFTSLSDFNSYVSGLTLGNADFNSQNTSITEFNKYFIIDNYYVYTYSYLVNTEKLKKGDIFLITETDVPDRWVAYASGYIVFTKLETSKIDLTTYATKSELSSAIDDVNDNFAPEYDSDTTYAIGDKVIYNGNLYTCTTAITTAESWDSTHWSQVSVASGFVDLDKEQVITGEKTFSTTTTFTNRIIAYWYGSNLRPYATATYDIGASSYKWKDLYLAGRAFISNLNGKSIPSYDANANWKGEWYGTQVEYDALGTYDSNTTYYILES